MSEPTKKDIMRLKVDLLKPYIETGSKAGLEKNQCLDQAKEAWQWVNETPGQTGSPTP